MIERQHGKILVECDSCPSVLDTDTDDFAQARAMMIREEWKISKIGGECWEAWGNESAANIGEAAE